MDLSRRDVFTVTAGAALAAGGASGAAAQATNDDLEPLTSRSGVYTPARGQSVMQFSFDFPEPSARIGAYLFSFRVQTFKNAYAIDAERTRVLRENGRVRVVCDGLLGDGGQTKVPGKLTAVFEEGEDGALEWRVTADCREDVKSVTTVVRGAPRGTLSVSANDFADHGDDEKIFEYPYLFGGMTTPLVMLKNADGALTEFSARQSEVRPARFFFQPGPDGYRVEMIYEREGWRRARKAETHKWRLAPAQSYEAAAAAHFDHVRRAYDIPDLKTRKDAPEWLHDIALVMAIHGAHWTGYLFNTYEQSLETLKWAANEIDPRNVLVFLPAWDGRYYWNYPLYKTDPRMGGDEGFKRLIEEGQKLGFRMTPMFGLNSANRTLAEFDRFDEGVTERVEGDAFDLNWVDWDNDRRDNGATPFMNVAVDEWRDWLAGRISSVIDQFGPDAYFLDIAGAWINNRKGDMYEGTRKLVTDLRARHSDVLPIAEMLYDAQMAYFSLTQVTRFPAYPDGADRHVRTFQHLSRPAPGRGSSGVHEAGFQVFDPDIPADQRAIPTLTIVDDTLSKDRAATAAYIRQAKDWFERRRG